MNKSQIEPSGWTPELLKQRRRRATIMAIILLLWVIMFFAVTWVRLSHNIAASSGL